MVAGLSTETNQKSSENIANKAFFRKLRPLTEFGFGPYLANGGGCSRGATVSVANSRLNFVGKRWKAENPVEPRLMDLISCGLGLPAS